MDPTQLNAIGLVVVIDLRTDQETFSLKMAKNLRTNEAEPKKKNRSSYKKSVVLKILDFYPLSYLVADSVILPMYASLMLALKDLFRFSSSQLEYFPKTAKLPPSS